MTEGADLDKRGSSIQGMFGAVAPRYDLLNRMLSLSMDLHWRRQSAKALEVESERTVLDLCCGTGDQALALRKRGHRVTAADFCIPMLSLAEKKYRRLQDRRPRGLAADAMVLPFADRTFSGATVSFGLRNVAGFDRALAEIYRVLAPGAKLAVLEFAMPRGYLLRRLYRLYFDHLLPRIGAWLSPRGSAYDYLAASVHDFLQRDAFVERMDRVGFRESSWRDLAGGTVCLYTGRK
jgi:demethylmenaquinone methyltransferase/2-methoxy-6-polyprenyl-1,4-benzoquinol methylase